MYVAASGFVDPDSGEEHLASRWRIYQAETGMQSGWRIDRYEIGGPEGLDVAFSPGVSARAGAMGYSTVSEWILPREERIIGIYKYMLEWSRSVNGVRGPSIAFSGQLQVERDSKIIIYLTVPDPEKAVVHIR